MKTARARQRLTRVSVPWLQGSWMLNEGQRRAVRLMLDAAMRGEAGARLAGVERLFAGTPGDKALGELVVQGQQGAWHVRGMGG